VPAEISEVADARRQVFFRLIFGRESGYVCLAFGNSSNKKDFQQEFFQWPEEEDLLLESVNEHLVGYNVWFCPQLLSAPERVKDNVSSTPVAWADLDRCRPDKLLVHPSVIIESSPGRYQAYWCLDRHPEPEDVEALSRRIAYRHAAEGADRSGWDLTQLLRVPWTSNYKYMKAKVLPSVEIVELTRTAYRMDEFEEYPEADGFSYLSIPMPSEQDCQAVIGDSDEAREMGGMAVLQRYRRTINPMVWAMYTDTPQVTSWSEKLWNMQMLLFEQGMTRTEVYVVCRDAACNKYARDGKDPRFLWQEVCRAEVHHHKHMEAFGVYDEDFLPLMSEGERELVLQQPDTFIERYITWARSLGDAAPQYHQAGAFVALSALIAGAVRLPTSFGTIIPNLWFMILADTTLTRKSTAMDIAMDMVAEIDPDAVLATDGSIEGLLTTLATRPGRPSVFLRDEFSGLLEQMTKKDYMAGMAELLTKLYDGKMFKRVLRKDTIEVKEPILVVFAGGIKQKVTSILTFEQVSSGFMPRFVFITAESDITKVKPLGPPSPKTTGASDAIREELEGLFKHYRVTETMQVKNSEITIQQQKIFQARLTEDAWVRYNKFESEMLQAGLSSERADVMTPTFDRLSKSVLKAAVLLSAAETRQEEVVVTEAHLLRAIFYGEQWRFFVKDVMSTVGKSQTERKFDTIYGAIQLRPGITKSRIMQSYHLDSREAASVISTLEDRGLITKQASGRGYNLYPVTPGGITSE